jgi:hypothetical protein
MSNREKERVDVYREAERIGHTRVEYGGRRSCRTRIVICIAWR